MHILDVNMNGSDNIQEVKETETKRDMECVLRSTCQ